MPPSVPRPSLQSFSALRAATVSSRCNPLLLALTNSSGLTLPSSLPSQSLSFSKTAATSVESIPPQSPKFITVPEPPQSSEVRRPPIRGHLPVPRPVFSKRDGADKAGKAYIAKTMPLSKSEQAGEPPRSDTAAWKRRMTESRRQSLAAGLKGLYHRKERLQRLARESRTAKLAAHQRAAAAPERLDDVLARPTVRAATANQPPLVLDPERFTAAERRATEHAARERARAEARREALSQLYIASKDFIVTEEELRATVDRVFAEDHFRKQGSVAIDSTNMWDARGSPPTIASMFSAVNRTQTSLISSVEGEVTRTTRRQKIVAEELTGGKMA